ncbi:MAG: hypothetical protein AB7F86_00920 [Bdellovibrionales bacterium]
MKWFLRLLWMVWGKQAVCRQVKRRSLAVYLRALRGIRISLMAALATFLLLQLMIFSGVGALVTATLLWDHDFNGKIEILFWVFCGLFAIPALAVAILMSERVWFRLSGARRIMNSID